MGIDFWTASHNAGVKDSSSNRGADARSVCTLTDWYWPDLVGGAERTARALAEELVERGFAVSVVRPGKCTRSYEDGHVRVNQIGVPTLRHRYEVSFGIKILELLRYWLDPVTRLKVRRHLRSRPADIYVLHNTRRFWPTLAKSLRRDHPNAHILMLHHDLTSVCARRSRYRSGVECQRTCLECRPQRAASRHNARYVDRHFAVSRYAAHIIGQELGVDVAVGYPLGADLVRSAPIRDQRKVAKGRGCRIGYLGRISPEKGVDVLIEAAALMEPIARLIVGGDTSGRYAAELRHTANGAGVDVEWLGVVTPADLAGRVDVAVVPSLWPEPFGRVAVELAGLGVHTVVTPVGGLPETAEIFPGRIHIATGTSPRDLADAVRDVLVDGMLEDRLRPALRGRPLSLVDAVVTSIASNVTSGSEALEVGDVRDEGSKEHG